MSDGSPRRPAQPRSLHPRPTVRRPLSARTPPIRPRPGIRPMNGLLALSEHPAGIMAVTDAQHGALADLGARPRYVLVDYLRDLCDDLAGTFGGSSGTGLDLCGRRRGPARSAQRSPSRLVADLLHHQRVGPCVPIGDARPDRRVLHGPSGGLGAGRRRQGHRLATPWRPARQWPDDRAAARPCTSTDGWRFRGDRPREPAAWSPSRASPPGLDGTRSKAALPC